MLKIMAKEIEELLASENGKILSLLIFLKNLELFGFYT